MLNIFLSVPCWCFWYFFILSQTGFFFHFEEREREKEIKSLLFSSLFVKGEEKAQLYLQQTLRF